MHRFNGEPNRASYRYLYKKRAPLDHTLHDAMELSCWSGMVPLPTLDVKSIKKMSKPVG
jgi:hypothetical protein